MLAETDFEIGLPVREEGSNPFDSSLWTSWTSPCNSKIIFLYITLLGLGGFAPDWDRSQKHNKRKKRKNKAAWRDRTKPPGFRAC